jgi:DNA invertase Pin-like site-specific DNA recombinase
MVGAEFQDLQSGLKSDRVQYQEMLRAASAGEFDCIVVWKLDRFGRDRVESGIQLRELQKVGVRVDSATEPNDSLLLRNILMDFAEEESRRISLRVSANKRTRAQEGRRTSKPPFGYSNVAHPQGGRSLEPNQDAPIVTEVFRMYASGRHSLADLRDYINRGSTSPNRPKTRAGVHHLLKNPVYVGHIRHGVWARSTIQIKSKSERQAEIFEVEGAHEPLVDQATFEKVQQRLQSNRGRASGAPHSPFLFAGMIRCACGYRYTGHRTGSKTIAYYCTRKNDAGDCDSHSINESRIKEVILPPIETLLARLSQKDVRKAVRKELILQQEEARSIIRQAKESLSETQKRLEGRLSSLEDAYLDGDIPRERYLVKRDEIMGQLQEVQAQLAAKPHLALPDMDQLFALANALEGEPPDDLEWRDIIEGTVDRIVIEGRNVKVEWKPGYEPDLLLALVTEKQVV